MSTYIRRTVTFAGGAALLLAVAALGTAPASAQPGGVDPPTNVRVTELDHTSATIAWDASPRADSYVMTWSPAPPPEWTGWVETTSTTATLPVTHPGATHYVTVIAKRGPASASASLRFVAPKAPPPPVPPTPEDVAATVSPGTLTLEWDPSVVNGKEAASYVVRWKSDNFVTVTSATSITRSLPGGADVEVTVSARNEAGVESAPSETVDVTVPPAQEWEPLGPPTGLEVVSDRNGRITRIQWNAPTGGVEPVTYRLNYRFGDQNVDQVIATSSVPFIDVPTAIGDLVVCPPTANPGQTWIIWVTAHSQGTTSPRSEEATVCLG
ncbi:MAG: fibronectin type III domain-containing protein [Micromonosporaceae bacterium]|jgi:hypothetical protein